MRTHTITTYSFSELSEEAKQKAIENERIAYLSSVLEDVRAGRLTELDFEAISNTSSFTDCLDFNEVEFLEDGSVYYI